MPSAPSDLRADLPSRARGGVDMSAWTPSYAGYPGAVIKQFFVNKDGETKTRTIKHLIWGDWMLVGTKKKGGLVEAYSRGKRGFVDPASVTNERVLEVVFVDIGQGDGCLVVTPNDEHLVIDAGEHDNMYRFLNWRYGRFKNDFEFDALFVTHPDQDHYKGFKEFFDLTAHPDAKRIKFTNVYHNGIVERKAKHSLGPRVKIDGKSHIKGLVQTDGDLDDFLSVESRWKGKNYPTLLNSMVQSDRVGNIRSLSAEDGFVPGFEGGKDLSIEVLGPVLTRHNGEPSLRWLSSVGKTKNGHSVVLKLQYKNISMMLGGDLNIPAEHLLLAHHTGLESPPKSEEHKTLVAAARKVFQVDIAKACHHGSADFTSIFLEALNPIATVISSGDDESHAHPRAETLGTIGLFSRGSRPLIFSTELARSTKERIKHPSVVRGKFTAAKDRLLELHADPNAKQKDIDKAEQQFKKLVTEIERSVAVYGAINVRTDGHKVLFAQKIERGSGWDTYRLEPQGSNEVLEYVAKHH